MTAEARVLCPACQTTSKPVGLTTVRALLRDDARDRLGGRVPTGNGSIHQQHGADAYRFCGSQDCDVVYFAEQRGPTFTKDQLRVPVGAKDREGERPLCYCFGHSVASIKQELRAKGWSDALQDIRGKMADPGCRCETENPSGSCCLPMVAKGIHIAEEELKMAELESDIPASGAKSMVRRRRTVATAGAIVSAVIASSCCWLPIVLVSIGLSGAAIATLVETFRPLLVGLALAALAAAFYFTYSRRQAVPVGGHPSDAPFGKAAECCPTPPPPPPNRGSKLASIHRAMLWAATAVVAVFVIAPESVTALIAFRGHTACCALPLDADTALEPAGPQGPAQASLALDATDPRSSGAAPSKQMPRTLTDLSDDARELKAAFNADKGTTKVLLIVSPRCPMCRYGARLVDEQVLTQIHNDRVKVYVVWIKRFFGDSRTAAQEAMPLVPDKRARHFWGGVAFGKLYGKVLSLPGKRSFAWDVYLIFDPQVEWGGAGSPPAPSFWMHQLGGTDQEHRLNGTRFREELRSHLRRPG